MSYSKISKKIDAAESWNKDKRRVKFNKKHIKTVPPRLRKWDGKIVTVVSWHENLADTTKKLFPNDKLVGYVEEMRADFPESELIPVKDSKAKISSMMRYCAFYQTKDKKWYVDLGDDEDDEYEDSTTYGPFESLDDAHKYVDMNFSNPGSFHEDKRRKHPIPKKSPNGKSVVKPKSNFKHWSN